MADTEYRVADLQERGWLLVEDGNHGEYRPRSDEFGNGEFCFIRAADMDGGRVLFDRAQRINATARARIRKGVGAPGDVLFSHKGTVGKIALVPADAPPFVCSPQTTFWRALDEQHIDRRYLYYFLCSEEFTDQWEARKDETDMAAYVSLTAQRELVVRLPEISTQRAIALLLGTLDDKIELSRRMNRTLEELVSALFKSWFVDFDPVQAKCDGRKQVGVPEVAASLFPDHFEDSALGPIPKSWRAGKLGEIAQNPRRGAAHSDIAYETPYIGLEHMPRRSITLDEWGSAADITSGKFRFNAGEFLFGKLRPYFHKVGIALVNGVCSTDILVVIPKLPSYRSVVLGHISSRDFVDFTDASSDGTRMPRTNWEQMARWPLAIPPPKLAASHTELVDPLLERIRRNVFECRTLAALRNTLLPSMLSGEITIKQSEKAVAEVA
jgi:type I restriction enzyme S subunit